MSIKQTIQGRLAIAVIYVFLGGTLLLFAFAIVGLAQWSVTKEMLQVWAATYSFLVGAVIGFYFGPAAAEGGQET